MSLRIETDTVAAVLLADGWHEVHPGTFNLDAYEYLEDDQLIHGGGHSGVCATGFTFGSDAGTLLGPLTSILAIRSTD